MAKDEVLLKCMEMEWQDHFQTRVQTWHSLEMEALLAVALIGIDWKLENIYATLVVSFLLILAAYFGVLITIRHRNGVEVPKFKRIIRIEEELGLSKLGGLFADVKPPQEIKWWHAFYLNRSSTMLFILRMHMILMAFGIIYLVSRGVQYTG